MKNFCLTEISIVDNPSDRIMKKLFRRIDYYNILNFNNEIIRNCIQEKWNSRRAERELKEIMEQNIDKSLTTTNTTKRGRL